MLDAGTCQFDKVPLPEQHIDGGMTARSGDQQMKGIRAQIGNGICGLAYCEGEDILGRGTPMFLRNWTPISFNRTAVERMSYS